MTTSAHDRALLSPGSGTVDRVRRSTQFLLILIVAMTGCAKLGEAGSRPSQLDGGWVLTSGSDAKGAFELDPQYEVTLELDGDTLSGVAACNQHGGNVEVNDGDIEVEPGNITQMACNGRGVMELEARYLDSLEAVDSYRLETGVLTLTGPDTELVYEEVQPIPEATFTGTDWRLGGLLHGSGAEATMSSPQPAAISFSDDGTFEGTTGCRDVFGHWRDDNGTIRTSDIELGAQPCRRLAAEQDQHLVSVLEAGFTVEIDENMMSLTSDQGELGLYYVARD